MSVNVSPLIILPATGGKKAARQNDTVYAYYYGYIVQGSPTVYIGDAPNLEILNPFASITEGDTMPPFEVVVYDKGFIVANEMA